MKGLMGKAWGTIRKSGYYAQEYALILLQWKLKVIRNQLGKWKRRGAHKELDKAYARVGAEVFAFHRGGQTDLQQMPLVDQKLKLAEEAETGLFAVEEEIETVSNQYQEKKAVIKAKCRMKRTESSGDDDPEGT
jgi:hypothetical protein